MDARRVGRSGAVLLVIGGGLETAALAVGTVISPSAETGVGSILLAGYLLGAPAVGLGLVATGVVVQGSGRAALLVAGVLALLIPVVNAVQVVTAAPFGPAPSQLDYFLFAAAITVAALMLLRNPRRPRAERWAIAVPAACFCLSVLALFAPVPAVPFAVVLPWGGMAVAGALLLRAGSRPQGAETRSPVG